MNIESHANYLTRAYPEGKYTCSECGDRSKDGEWYQYKPGLSIERLCAECARVYKKKKREEQIALYASGEETPEYTDNITCPWCGYEDTDSWESAEEDDESECPECGGIFSYTRDVTVTYSSGRVRPPEEEDEITP